MFGKKFSEVRKATALRLAVFFEIRSLLRFTKETPNEGIGPTAL
jgi:hypothetical protein